MLHLFKKVYIDFKYPSSDFNSITATEDFDLLELLLIAKLNCIKNNKKLVIVADKNLFIKLAAQWHKSVFEFPTSESCYTILKCHLLKENQLIGLDKSVDVLKDTVIKEDDYSIIYNSVEKLDTCDFLDDISFEFLLTSYLYNQSFKEELKKVLHKLVKKDMQNFIEETRDTILLNSAKTKLQHLLKTKKYSYKNLENLICDPNLAWFFEVFKTGSFSWQCFDDETFSSNFVENCSNFLGSWVHSNSTNPCVTKLNLIPIIKKDSISDEDLNTIIQYNLHNLGQTSFSDFGRKYFNVYFLDHILETYQDISVNTILGNVSLQPYLLRK